MIVTQPSPRTARTARRTARRRGQGMTEYIVIVGLIAIGLIAAVRVFGTSLDVAIRGTEGALRNSGATDPNAANAPNTVSPTNLQASGKVTAGTNEALYTDPSHPGAYYLQNGTKWTGGVQ